MFDRYMTAKTERPRRWVKLTVGVSVFAHIVGGLALVAVSFWKIERVQAKTRVLELGRTPPPAPPAANSSPPPGVTAVVTHKVVAKRADEPLQPVKQPDIAPAIGGGPVGAGTGPLNPQGPTCVGDDCAPPCVGDDCPCVGDDCPCVGEECDRTQVATPDAGVPVVVANVAPIEVASRKISGTEQFQPPASVVQLAMGQGVDVIRVTAQLCVGRDGAPSSVSILKSSGYAELDALVQDKLGEWRYQPYYVQGDAVPFCTKIPYRFVLSAQ